MKNSDNKVKKSMNSKNILNYKDLAIELHPEVYEPAEDTFQLLEIINIRKGDKVLEIGTGCGVIALECIMQGAEVICTDINPYAVDTLRRTIENNKQKLSGPIEVRLGDLFTVVKPDENFDVIIFNPPYLPTQSEDRTGGSGWFDVAVDGGSSGLEITNRFLESVKYFLKKNGSAYFVFSSLCDRTKLEEILNILGFKSMIISSKNYDDETLDIYKIFIS